MINFPVRIFSKIFFFLFLCSNVFAQDFGFGFDDDFEDTIQAISLKISGEIAVEMAPYVHDFSKDNSLGVSFWDMVSGKLNFSFSSSSIDAVANLNLSADSISELWNASPNLRDPSYTPLFIDEAFMRAFIGPVNITAGLRKLHWGKADSFGPLDVTNPIDYSDLKSIVDLRESKIARPMIHVNWSTGSFSKLEGVFIPNFAGHRISQEGRWAPVQYSNIISNIEADITTKAAQQFGALATNPLFFTLMNNVRNNLMNHFSNAQIQFPSTGGLEYFQAGLRYTTTIRRADIGAQYFYGNLFRPNITINGIDAFLDDLSQHILAGDLNYSGNPDLISPQIRFTRYHQFGVDYAQVFLGFNLRSELAFFLT
jgi:hypothetical protein